jgi:co-chaperonin GroES (HSP10)
MDLMNNNVLLQEVEEGEDEKTPSGIVIPKMGAHTRRCLVIATGPGKPRPDRYYIPIPMDVSPGDEVVIPNDTGIPVILDGKHYLVVCEDDILLYFKKKKEEDS